MKMRRSCLVLALAACVSAYDIIKEYAGDSFFDDWDFYGSWDNLTLGAHFLFPYYFYSTLTRQS